MEYKKYGDRRLRHWASVPFIWMMMFPLVLLDIMMEIYHRVCFMLYGIPYISRDKYILMDRQRLKYLPWYDKLNCAYCGYANGLLSYAVAIAGATEKYWCGIKHKPMKRFIEPAHQKDFMAYGDKKAFEKVCKLENGVKRN
jgi:hypothetical protein